MPPPKLTAVLFSTRDPTTFSAELTALTPPPSQLPHWPPVTSRLRSVTVAPPSIVTTRPAPEASRPDVAPLVPPRSVTEVDRCTVPWQTPLTVTVPPEAAAACTSAAVPLP